MLSGTNGSEFAGWTYNVSPHGIPSRFVSPSGENRSCLACHNDVQPAPGAIGYGALGGHSFNVVQGTPTATVFARNSDYSSAATVAGSQKFTVTNGPSLLKNIFPGDTLLISAGADLSGTPFTVSSVDSASQLTVTGGSFTGGAVTGFTLTSVPKYNTAACVQCHPTALDFRDVARGNYDGGIAGLTPVQDQITGLLNTLATQINLQLATLLGNSNNSFTVAHGRISYALTPNVSTGPWTTFPGPGVPLSQNPTAWSSLSDPQKTAWLALYKAAYNWSFVTNDRSTGIHNTGYAVNLLQSSINALNPAAQTGAPFVPFP
jgi:hypothetical protein